ncbi:GGDEF domain-containing protein [Bordetella pseudohinzii]|uniref:Cyclic di-GMP phosphodiesterase Gmr n=1 Tax=Bordetella pseudohinzii TaxID=1331258 RepID=A0A0J6CBF7_9BORD|nr:GGDEF domain-containing protein [Bordetella pseudohinzii]ANY14613.1 diguanylate cyclase [Bordetella pseudohinzii]KMM26807.1 diguanylate cyclase [Bordetella pseudohinzii]KXA75084.1 diguanylate cyclase [Bordetella pseudohinzii]KXA75778.1 diguanylate cyclase [Bordetella pseudohinzii]CUI61627.1 Cyclic di-GMP phosphodiesterase Gmr [Bordetella pseudohinzii]
MLPTRSTYSMPTWRLTRWLAHPGQDVPLDIQRALIGSLFGTLSIFIGGVLNSLMVAAVLAWRVGTPIFYGWVALELFICITRGGILISAHRHARRGGATHTDVYLLLTLGWAGSVGYGITISALSGDWIAIAITCLSAAAMVGGICFRNFGAPRLTAAMVILALGPCIAVPIFNAGWQLWVIGMQLPLYIASMTVAAYKLNAMLVATMRAERENDERARRDFLTGLLNRLGLSLALSEAATLARERGEQHALLYLDLDGFKAVNDTSGHASGDRLLREVAQRLCALAPDGSAIARIGGDEFVLLLRVDRHADPRALGERLIADVSKPYELGEAGEVGISASLGIALIPQHGHDMVDILKAADRALYLAKSAGKGRWAMAA